MSKRPFVIGYEQGNGFVKAKTRKEDMVLPSVLVPASTISEDNFNSNDTGIKIYSSNKKDGEEYAWGEKATEFDYLSTYGAQDRYKSELYKLLNEFALAELLLNATESERHNVVVVTGLPSMEKGTYLDKDVIKSIEGSHVVTVDDQEIVFKIKEVKVVAQPVGTMMYLYLDEEGLVQDEDLEVELVGIIDVGTGTTDLDIFSKLIRTDSGKASAPFGMHDVYRKIQQEILKTNPSSNADLAAIEKQFNSDSFVISKRSIVDIRNVKDKAIEEVSNKIKNKITSTWKTWERLDRIYITGGGASVIGPKIQELIPDAIIVEDSQKANAKGYYRWGVSQYLGDDI